MGSEFITEEKKEEKKPVAMTVEREKADWSSEFWGDGRTLEQRKEAEVTKGPKEVMEASVTVEHFLALDSKLRAGDYEKKGMFKWKRKPSTEMKAIFDAIDEYKRFSEEIIDKDSFESDFQKGKDLYYDIISYCDLYMSNHKPKSKEGELRLDYVRRIKESVAEELKKFGDSAGYYKDSLRTDGKKWIDAVMNTRVRRYQDGKDGVKVETGGGATSKVYILSGGQKKLFFKESEQIPRGSGENVLDLLEDTYRKSAAEYPSDTKEYAHQMRKYSLLESFRGAIPATEKKEFFSTIAEGLGHGLYRKPEDKGAEDPDAKDSYEAWKAKLKKYFAMNPKMGEWIDKNGDRLEIITEMLADFGRLESLAETAEAAKILQPGYNSVRAKDDSETGRERTLPERNVVTSRLAEALGISDLIAKSELVTVEVEGKKMTGVAMEEAPGMDMTKALIEERKKGASGKTAHYSGKALRQLSNLQIFDILCGQVDRNDGNILGQYRSDDSRLEVESVMGIDNDMAFGLLSYRDIIDDQNGIGTFKKPIDYSRTKQKYEIVIPHMDTTFTQHLLDMTPEQIYYLTLDILSDKEREFLCDRLSGLQAMIRQAIEEEAAGEGKRKIFFSEDSEWEEYRDVYEKASFMEKSANRIHSYQRADYMGDKIE